MNKPKFILSIATINNYFRQSKKSIFTFADLQNILENQRLVWDMPTTMSSFKFIGLLLEHTDLKKTSIEFPTREWGGPSLMLLTFAIISQPIAWLYQAES